MESDWIFDVLKDLRTFAEQNGLPQLAASVSDTERVARGELAPVASEEGDVGNGELG